MLPRFLPLIVLVGCGAEPVVESKVAAPVIEDVAAPVLPRTVTGAWFSLVVPGDWEERPLRTDAERGVSEGMWRTPVGVTPANMLVAKPVPFVGDVDGFAAQSLFVFQEFGLGTMVADGEQQLGEQAARRFRGTLSMMGKSRSIAYWFLVKDGSGLALQCGGDGADWYERCVEIAGSFRVTGAVPPSSVALPVAAVSRRELPGYTAELREDWQMFQAVRYPDAVFQVRASAPVAGQFPGAVLRRRAWTGGKRWDVDVEKELAGEGATVRRREAITLLGVKTTLFEIEVPPRDGGYTALVTGIVVGGEELRLSCVASPLVIAALRPDCLRMIASLARAP